MGEVERDVEWGLDRIDPSRRVEMSLRDALFVYKVLGEFISFFHQPLKYPTLEAVENFLGDVNEGAFHVLYDAYYQRMRDIWPADVEELFNDGALDRNPFVDP